MKWDEEFCGYSCIYIDSVVSSNALAAELISGNTAPDQFFIRAGYQEQGKGQGGNSWHSEANQNILFSIGLKPKGITPEKQFIITQAVSLGILSVLRNVVAPERLKIKWPNDIYIDNCKLSGMLISNIISGSELQWTIIGVGLNVNQTHFPDSIPAPVSLTQITGKIHDTNVLSRQLLCAIDQKLKYPIDPMLRKQLEVEYHKCLYKLNCWNEFKVSGERVRACIRGVAEYGRLELEKENGETINVGFGELVFL